jgi:polyisoprenoid-binding protein YceI
MGGFMRLNFTKYGFYSVIFLASTQTMGAVEKYTLDPMHSYVEWHANHFDFSHPSGKWMANGIIELDNEKIENSKVQVTINVADIVTGIPELDKHLKSKLFFDVEKFPKATFVSDKIDVQDKNISKVHGILTVRGIAKPIELNVKLNKKGSNPVSDKESIGFTAQTQLKRSDFGINTLLPGLGDDIKLDIEVEASKD